MSEVKALIHQLKQPKIHKAPQKDEKHDSQEDKMTCVSYLIKIVGHNAD